MNRVTMTGLEQGVVHFPARAERLVYDDIRLFEREEIRERAHTSMHSNSSRFR